VEQRPRERRPLVGARSGGTVAEGGMMAEHRPRDRRRWWPLVGHAVDELGSAARGGGAGSVADKSERKERKEKGDRTDA
jgi:hypothetical protein